MRSNSDFAVFAILFAALVSTLGCAANRIPDSTIAWVDVPPFSSRRTAARAALNEPIGLIAVDEMSGEDLERAPSRFCINKLSNGIGLPEEDERLARFDTMLRAEFRARGYETVSAVALNETWDRVFDSSEDIFDPHTGQRDNEKLEIARLAALAALHEELGCDFLVTPEIVLVSAAWLENRVAWDGIESYFTEGINPGAGLVGYVGAVSLHLRILDLDDQLVHFGTGGIQVTSQLKGGFVSDNFIEVDPDLLLLLEDRNRGAVRLALRAMKRRAKPNE